MSILEREADECVGIAERYEDRQATCFWRRRGMVTSNHPLGVHGRQRDVDDRRQRRRCRDRHDVRALRRRTDDDDDLWRGIHRH